MQKNTKTASILAVLTVVIVSFISLTAIDWSDQQIESETQEMVVQVISGSMPNYSLEKLTNGAEYIIIGNVEEIRPVVVETERMKATVFSDVVITVKEDLANKYAEKEISVRIEGGTVDSLKTISEPSAKFTIGDNVLFFVAEKEPDSMWGDNYYVAGGYLGKYNLSDDDTAHRDKIPGSVDTEDLITVIKQIRGS